MWLRWLVVSASTRSEAMMSLGSRRRDSAGLVWCPSRLDVSSGSLVVGDYGADFGRQQSWWLLVGPAESVRRDIVPYPRSLDYSGDWGIFALRFMWKDLGYLCKDTARDSHAAALQVLQHPSSVM